jgi:hypothetical protein
VERYNRTLQVEWAYRQVFITNQARSAALDPWLKHYNTSTTPLSHRRHTADQPAVNNVPARYT